MASRIPTVLFRPRQAFLFLTLSSMLAAEACSSSSTGLGDVQHTLRFYASHSHEGIRYSCFARGTVWAKDPFPAEWTGPVEFLVRREAHGPEETLRADSLLTASWVTITVGRKGKVGLELPGFLGGDAAGNLQGDGEDGISGVGHWGCPGGFPLKDRPGVVSPLENPPPAFFSGMWWLFEGPPIW